MYLIIFFHNRLNVISTSGFPAPKPILYFGPTITARFMTAMSCLLHHSASIRSLEGLISLVSCNVSFITMDGESLIFLFVNLISYNPSLHAGISTIESRVKQAISQSAFVDAVDDYVENSVTDDEGSGIEAD